MIQMYNVSKCYPNGVNALVDVSVTIEKGNFVFLVGPSGAGKSTFTKLIFREELPTSGQILFDGKSVTRMKDSEVPYLRRQIGVVFQDFRLLPHKTVFDNVAFAMEIVEAPRRKIRARVPQVLDMVGLAEKAKLHPHQLSGGEQQRVSIARAIVNDPLVIIADEPTGNLDPETAQEIMNLLLSINGRGTTIIMATHARDIVDNLRRRVIALDGGQIVRDEARGGYEAGDDGAAFLAALPKVQSGLGSSGSFGTSGSFSNPGSLGTMGRHGTTGGLGTTSGPGTTGGIGHPAGSLTPSPYRDPQGGDSALKPNNSTDDPGRGMA
ncbi:cell division transport system ATP-binding protein [Heliophilum fasciatum]|uniref:Cell division ATP-binding protein FtsE n=1 Tax=Heliophilum fasciatum TaxID=35700 RepID=A0A4R2RBT5_9FIRM|nr:cell division transport system ATP-binding protein [Heliophilum fasciatum]TCP60810.1 cell division transport system ATP-binding protein [Heliophilum fasciatum]